MGAGASVATVEKELQNVSGGNSIKSKKHRARIEAAYKEKWNESHDRDAAFATARACYTKVIDASTKKSRKKRKLRKSKKLKRRSRKKILSESAIEELKRAQDPWSAFKSVFGGALSPEEAFEKLLESDSLDRRKVVSIDRNCKHVLMDEETISQKFDGEGLAFDRLDFSKCANVETFTFTAYASRIVIHIDISTNKCRSLKFVPADCVCWLRSCVARENLLCGTSLCSAVFRSMPKLLKLDISFNPIQHIPKDALPRSLRWLACRGCGLRSDSMSSFDHLEFSLAYLDIAENNINDSSMFKKKDGSSRQLGTREI